MSKKRLINFLSELDHSELQEQIIDLYSRFKNVKEFYDFSFNPDEDKRLLLAKQKIAKEYFPEEGKKVKKRRSVAHKIIGQLIKLEADPKIIIDIMLYNIEVAQAYTIENRVGQEAFYTSMLKSFQQALNFIQAQYTTNGLEERLDRIIESAYHQDWINKQAFATAKKEILAKE